MNAALDRLNQEGGDELRAILATAGFDRLEHRIGVHTGPVIVLGDDLIGPGAGKASRITDLARPGQVLVSAETRRLADEDAWFGPSWTVEIRGLDDLHELFPLLALHRPVPTR